MNIPIISIVGLSGSGKTTLVEKLISSFSESGFRVGSIKHSKHDHDLDTKGKDSWRHKKAGADRVLFVGPKALQLVSNLEGDTSPQSLAQRYFEGMDFILVEGFLDSDTDKIELVRSAVSTKPVLTREQRLIACVTDLNHKELSFTNVPVFNLNDIDRIAEFISKSLGIPSSKHEKLPL